MAELEERPVTNETRVRTEATQMNPSNALDVVKIVPIAMAAAAAIVVALDQTGLRGRA